MDQAKPSTADSSVQSNLKPATVGVAQLLSAIDKLPAMIRDGVEQQLARGGSNLELLIPHHQIAFGDLANRHKDAFRDVEFEQLKAAIEVTEGNQVPIIVRPVCGRDAHEKFIRGILFEVIAGHRRLRACQALNLAVKAILIPEMSDLEAARLMQAENAERKSLSPYEAGAMYANWLRKDLYKSQNELAEKNKLQPSEVSRALTIARLPKLILDAFRSPREIQFKDAEAIGQLLERNEDAVLAKAEELAAQNPKKSRGLVLQALTEVAAEKSGVGSANTAKKQVLRAADQDACEINWGAKGGARIDVKHQLDDAAKLRLVKLLDGFMRKELGASKSKATSATK